MPEKRYDLREIARAALGDMPPKVRADLLTEMLVEINGDDALHLMAHARNIVTLRIEQLIDERYPLDSAEIGNIRSVHRRFHAVNCAGDPCECLGFFDLEGAKKSAVLIRERRGVKRCADQETKLERIVCYHEDHLLDRSKTPSDSARNRDANVSRPSLSKR
ncbi:hypothetical protein [Paracoccus onubensis]|uniref:Uncharacterized protein n=1 Tax=Paracoccus onubensis TaxID=1675788 RepID=A0A418T1P9_9RHOB|nr:hypothetical protein [Paracoccus onubensis]RJE87106.1 hypothetical protein D3P04_04970 [Paracoccus onubensis]